MLGESQRGHLRPCSGGLAVEEAFRPPLPEPWLLSLSFAGFAGDVSSGDMVSGGGRVEAERGWSKLRDLCFQFPFAEGKLNVMITN